MLCIRAGPTPWPARSPDMNPLDFYLRGRLKSLVYASAVSNVEVLQQRIERACGIVRNELNGLCIVQRSLRRRAQKCSKAQGEPSRAVASRSKASHLGLALRNARWFESSWEKKFSYEISASVWDRCPPSIVMHLRSYDRSSLAQDNMDPTDLLRLAREDNAVSLPTSFNSSEIFCVIVRRKSSGTEKNYLRHRDLNACFQLYVLMLYPLSHTGFPSRWRIESSQFKFHLLGSLRWPPSALRHRCL
ncbi:hypothetical protein ANN_07540 [Periplaneta americana]|uniref:Uncharacterized protein n=1 Tax=Periplaneta americana TaxID=6978 RepID=A0ABQ8T053_PERAM|nr:hypothetical protein ANN_07540 [Periplaneta americana]